MNMKQDQAAIEGRLRAIAADGFTDPWQGVSVVSEARQVPSLGGVGVWALPVHFAASCAVCEWAFFYQQMPSPGSSGLGFGSPNLLEVQSWPGYHLKESSHQRAWKYLKENADLLTV